ncbi:hypothetical protein V6N12_023915 [Hibiscus sabdariffa]|uniref:Uncharacterized protein n=1 Tax=Hibiscus sabdariffa TaxID=183260 RepID=A0ABR2FZ29_9ROSI
MPKATSMVMNKQHRQIEGVIDEDKMAILNLCAIGFCRKPYKVADLADKFCKAGLQGFSIETDWRFHIDEDLELRVGEQCFPIRVTEIEEAIGPKCDSSCELVEESEFSGKHDEKEDVKEKIDTSVAKGGDSGNYSVGIVMPNSVSLKAMNSLEMEKMWEANKLVHWHVMETASWMADENIGMVQRDEEVRYSNVSAECVLREEIQVRVSEDAVVNSPFSRGPSNRAPLAERDGTDSLVLKMREMKRVLKEWNLLE